MISDFRRFKGSEISSWLSVKTGAGNDVVIDRECDVHTPRVVQINTLCLTG
jgi:hypothetical protein